jgi:hypothetical protein
MRMVLGLVTFAALAGSAFAVNELRALRQVTAAAPRPEAPEAATAPEPVAVAEAPARQAPPLSTWRGTLPFGGVPGEPDDVSADHAILDSVDRCPDNDDDEDGEAGQDDDGCPDRTVVHDGRVITLSHTIIIIDPPEALDNGEPYQLKLDRIIY